MAARLPVLCAGFAFCTSLGGIALGEDANAPDDSESYTLPEVTVSAPVPSDYTTLPERDLIGRPFTESPGLETSTSVVGRQEIGQMHAYSVVDALKYVPGAWTETRGRKVKSFFSVRGQRYPYPGYLIDGAWFREFHEINYYLSAANFDRIDVVRSSGALLLGPGGMTGMINLVPRMYEQQETLVESLYGTHNTYRGHVTHGTAGAKYSYGLSTGYYHTDGSDGMNARENMTNLFGRLQYQLSEELTLSWTNFALVGDRQLKLAEPPANSTLQTRRDSFDPMSTYLTVAKLRHESSDERATELIGNYGGRRFKGKRVPISGVVSEALEEDYEYGTSVIHSRKLSPENTLRFNMLYNRWVSPTGKRFYVGSPADLRTYSGAIIDDHDFGRLDVSIGYRYTRDHTKQFGGFNVEGSPQGLKSVEVRDKWEEPLHTVNLGASYELTPSVSLFGNTAWGQLSAPHGMLDQNLSRPDTEDRYKFDLGVKKHFDGFGEASVTGFFVRQDDAALLTNQKVTVDGVDFALFENGDRKNFGLELDIHSNRFDNGIQFFFNATAMKTKRTRSGSWEHDKEVPDFVLGGGASYLFGKFELALFGSHVSRYENERFLPAGTPAAPLGDYVELNTQLTYKHDDNTELFVRVDNFTDDEYSTVVGYPHDGTLVYTGVVIRL
jgi:outer membrane receptor protein involved in Fe transport